MAITREDVYEAAAKVRAKGEHVTITKIREQLGTGSFSTIQRHFDSWRTAEAVQERETLPDVPEAVEQATLTAIREVWRQALTLTRREVADVKEALEKRLKEMQAERDEALGEVERLEKAGEAAAQETAALKGEVADLSNRLAAATAVEGQLRERLESEEARHKAQVRDLETRQATLERELSAAEGRVKAADGERAKAEAEVGRAQKANAALESQVQAARTQASELEARVKTAAGVEKELRDRVRHEEERCQALDGRVAELTKELARIARARADEAPDDGGGGSPSPNRKDRK